MIRSLLLGGLLLLGLAGCQRAPEPVRFIDQGRPAHLSDWHVLNLSGGRLRLNLGVEPYELNTPLFTDYAQKLRTIWMPPGKAASYDAEATFDFPVGTIITKTFYYPRGEGGAVLQVAATGDQPALNGIDLSRNRLMETRLLVRRAEGWVALPYVWNAEQTDAELMRTGDQARLDLVDPAGKHQAFTYVVPNENQCASCHVVQLKTKAFQPIGPKARHLNRQQDYASGPENQLQHLAKVGYLAGLPATELPKATDWKDASASLDARARAYLDINCSHCHSPKGSASNTALNLEPFLPLSHKQGLCKPPVAAGKGTGDRLFGIVPGRPDASIMAYRLGSTEGGVMMPELGRSTVHVEGLQLIHDWIASLPGGCEAASPDHKT
jgi:uncharacterized repeat protein (TIGR03806 family)